MPTSEKVAPNTYAGPLVAMLSRTLRLVTPHGPPIPLARAESALARSGSSSGLIYASIDTNFLRYAAHIGPPIMSRYAIRAHISHARAGQLINSPTRDPPCFARGRSAQTYCQLSAVVALPFCRGVILVLDIGGFLLSAIGAKVVVLDISPR